MHFRTFSSCLQKSLWNESQTVKTRKKVTFMNFIFPIIVVLPELLTPRAQRSREDIVSSDVSDFITLFFRQKAQFYWSREHVSVSIQLKFPSSFLQRHLNWFCLLFLVCCLHSSKSHMALMITASVGILWCEQPGIPGWLYIVSPIWGQLKLSGKGCLVFNNHYHRMYSSYCSLNAIV